MLFNVHTLELEGFFGRQPPPYAILSHRWGPDEEELTFRDVQAKHLDKPGIGSVKLRGCITQAKADGLAYVWVDTFCINKADDATELAKAINSMFMWYKAAAVCYVHLCDVADDVPWALPDLIESQWFRRGWTLQELLAPRHVCFYDRLWVPLGTKHSLSAEVEEVTGISAGFLEGVWEMEDASIAQRMSWAAGRVTKEPEDAVYSLLGIFGVNMPLIYGEGANAFYRLQEEILKKTPDDSILAWGMSLDRSLPPESPSAAASGHSSGTGILATSPRDFLGSGGIAFTGGAAHIVLSTGSLGIEVALHTDSSGQLYGLLHCHAADNTDMAVGVPLERASTRRSNDYVRSASGRAVLLSLHSVGTDERTSPAALVRVLVRPPADNDDKQDGPCRFWIKGLQSTGLRVVETSPEGLWQPSTNTVTVPAEDLAWKHIWLRLRRRGGSETDLDFVVVLHNELTVKGRRDMSQEGVNMALCSPESRLPKADHGKRRSCLEYWEETDQIATSYLNMSLRQSKHYIGAKLTHVIELGLVDEDDPQYYVDLTHDFDMMDLESRILEDLEWTDKSMGDTATLRSLREAHQQDVDAVDSSIEALNATMARLEHERQSLMRERDVLAAKSKDFEPVDECDRGVAEVFGRISRAGAQLAEQHVARGHCPFYAENVVELVSEVLSERTRFEKPEHWGWSSLETAAYLAARQGKRGTLEYLRTHEGSRELNWSPGLAEALLWCTSRGEHEAMRVLLEGMASPEGLPDEDPPLLRAVYRGDAEAVRLLFEHGASVEVKDGQGLWPEDLAAGAEGPESIGLLPLLEGQREKERDLKWERNGRRKRLDAAVADILRAVDCGRVTAVPPDEVREPDRA